MQTCARWQFMGEFKGSGIMGTAQQLIGERGEAIKASKGIAIRHWKDNGTTIRISFWYKGVECRETLSLPATKANLQYAERLRGEVINAIAKGTFNYGEYFPDSKRARIFGHVNANPLIGERLKEFLVQAERTLQKSTVMGYKKVSHAHLFKTFGNIPIRDLSPAYLRRWLGNLTVTAKTTRNILTPLRAVLEEAVNDDIIARNPLDRVVLGKLLNKTTKQSDYVPDPFNRKEIQALLAHAELELKPLVQLAFFTGLRPSELIALQWQDIDWVNGLAHIRRAVVERQEKCTKTVAGKREVLLLPPALEALQAQKAFTFLEGKRVFHHPRTQRPWETDRQLRNVCWEPLLKKAGVRYRNFYQTRHTYASMLLSAGENMLWVARQMGHKDTEMIIRTYGKWIPDISNKAGYQLKQDWAQILPSSSPLTAHPS